jgi:hypothetical protein
VASFFHQKLRILLLIKYSSLYEKPILSKKEIRSI